MFLSHSFSVQNDDPGGARLAQLLECATLVPGVRHPSPALGVEITF